MKLRLISYDTWKKDHWGNLFGDGYSLCAETYDYNLFGSINPKDLATKLIHDNLSDEFAATLEFVYVPHKYKGYQSKKDWLEVWYKKTEHPFQVGQYILIKWAWPGEPEWGVWKVGKYKFGGIEYKMHLTPVGETAKKFEPMDRYTCDFSYISPNHIFNNKKDALKCLAEIKDDHDQF